MQITTVQCTMNKVRRTRTQGGGVVNKEMLTQLILEVSHQYNENVTVDDAEGILDYIIQYPEDKKLAEWISKVIK